MAYVINSKLKRLPRSTSHANKLHCRRMQQAVHRSCICTTSRRLAEPFCRGRRASPGIACPPFLDQSRRDLNRSDVDKYLGEKIS
jgi:hypothetical protein